MIQVQESIYKNLNLNRYDTLIPKWSDKSSISIGQFIEALLKYNSGPKAIESLGRSPQTFNRYIKKLFPSVSLKGGGESWTYWLISQSDYKHCTDCKIFKLRTEYNKDKSTSEGLSCRCKSCANTKDNDYYHNNPSYFDNYRQTHRKEQAAKSAKRRALLLQRTVKWANLEEIEQFYISCPEGYHVDHHYPLQGEIVCGLHVIENLQYLTAKDNMSKGNSMPT